MKNLILASTSTIYGSNYLEYLMAELAQLFEGVQEILFIPYAQPNGITYNDYTAAVKKAFTRINISVKGIHELEDEQLAVKKAQGIFVGGGNTFLLVKQLYDKGLMNILKIALESGIPYLGTSAGSNICGVTMQTTNDMPIVMPTSYETLGIIPLNINAHYLDPDPTSKHQGETRETRIKEYHIFNDTPVLGLREGSWLQVRAQSIVLKGPLSARLFKKNENAVEIASGTQIKVLV